MANKLSEVKVTTGRGSTIKVKDLGKKAPTPNPTPTKKAPRGTADMDGSQYDAYLRSLVKKMNKG